MGDLDRLGIQIEAEGKKADDALSRLEQSLAGISDLLKGLKVDGHISKDLSSIAASTREIASAVKGLSGAGFEKVASSARSATESMGKTADAVKNVADAAKGVKGVNFQLVSDSEIGRLMQLKQNYQAFLGDVSKGRIVADDSMIQDATIGLERVNAAIKEYKASISDVVPEAEKVNATMREMAIAMLSLPDKSFKPFGLLTANEGDLPNFQLIGEGYKNAFTVVEHVADDFVRIVDCADMATSSMEKMLPAVVNVNTQLAVMRDNVIDTVGRFVSEGDGAVAKVNELASAMSGLSKRFRFDGLTESDLTHAIEGTKQSVRELEQEIRDAFAAGKFDDSSVKAFADDMKFLTDYINQAEGALWDLQNVRKKLGGHVDAPDMKNATGGEDDISKRMDTLLGKIREYKRLIASMEGAKIPFDHSAYTAAVNGIREAEAAVNAYKQSINGIQSAGFNVPDLTGPLRGMTSIIEKELSVGLGIFRMFGGKVKGVLDGLSKFWSRTMRTLKFMLVRKAFMALIKDIGEASKSLAQFDGELGRLYKGSMTTIVSNLRWLGANIVAAFSPIVNAVAPIIDALIAKLEAAIAVINQFFSALSGKAIFVRAKKNMQEYGAAVGGAGKQAKKLKDYLLGIDELNVLKPDENTGGGGGGASGYPYEWEEQDIAKNIKDLADKIKALFKNGDFYRLGQMLAEILADALWNIDWIKIQKAAERIATNIADFINGFFSVDKLWKGIGRTIAQGLNTALIFADTLLRKIDWGQIGRQIGNLINQAVREFDWGLLGRTIADAINAAFSFLYNLSETIDFTAIGKGISEAINKLFSTVDLSTAGAAISNVTKGILDALISAIENVNWSNVGKKIGQFFANIDWAGIFKRVAKLIWGALNAAISAGASMFSAAPFTTAILGIVGVTALLRTKALKNVVVFAKGVNGVLKSSMITSETTKMQLAAAKVISEFKTGFSNGGVFPGLSKGLASIKSQMTPLIKVIGTVLGAVANFSIASNFADGFVKGTKSIGDAFLGLLVPIGLVEAALLALFGPASAIIGGIAVLVGAIFGAKKAHEEMVAQMTQDAFSAMIEGTAGAGHTLDDLKIKMQDTASSVLGEIQKLRDGFGTLNDYIRPSIGEAMTTISGIVAAITETRSATEGQLEELGNAFKSLEDMTTQYVQQLYDNLIAMDLAQYQYIASVHGAESEEAKAIAKRIGNLYIMKDTAVESARTMASEFSESMQEYVSIMTNAEATEEDLIRANELLGTAFGNLATKSAELGIPLGDMEKHSKIAKDAIGELKGQLDLSDAKIDQAEDILGKFNDVINSNVDTYNNARSELQSAKDEHIAMLVSIGTSAEEAQRQANEAFDRLFGELDSGFIETMSQLQQDAAGLFPQFAEMLAETDLDPSQIQSQLNEFAESLFSGDDGLTKMLENATKNVEFPEEIVSSEKIKSSVGTMFDTINAEMQNWDGSVDFVTVTTGLSDNFANKFNSAMGSVTTEEGKNVVLGIVSGIENNIGGAFNGVTEKAAQAIEESLQTANDSGSPAMRFAPEGENVILGVAEGMKETSSVANAAKVVASEIDKNLSSALDSVGNNVSFERLAVSMQESFSVARMKTIFSGIPQAMKQKWDETVMLWRSGFEAWFNNDVTPNFVTQKWLMTTSGMKDGTLQTWKEFTIQWNAALMSWWTMDVVPWFSQDRWQPLGDSMRAGILQGFKGIVNDFAQVMNSLIDVFNHALRNIGEGLNSTIQSFNNVMSSQGMAHMPLITVGTINKVPQFRAGGFPEDGLFMANSSELVGRFDNGKTAVVNNEQIQSGVRESMREALIDTLGTYLSRIADNTEKTAEKDNRIFLDTRELTAELDRRRARNGFSFSAG